jgi:hypothetical protein
MTLYVLSLILFAAAPEDHCNEIKKQCSEISTSKDAETWARIKYFERKNCQQAIDDTIEKKSYY